MIYLMRHGKDNEDYIGGWSEIPLTKEGVLEVTETAQILNNSKKITIDKIIQKYPQNRYIVIKDKLSSSNHSIVSNLMKYGYFENDSIIKYSSKNGIELKDIKENSIILIIEQ